MDPPSRRLGSLDAGVDRQERGPGHAVLEPGPRRQPGATAAAREPLVEGADVPSERQDLLPGEVEAILRHAASPRRGVFRRRKRGDLHVEEQEVDRVRGVLADRRADREEHPSGELGDLVDHQEPLIARDP